MSRPLLALVSALASLALASPAQAVAYASQYTFSVLETPQGSTYSAVTGLNNLNQLSGWARGADGVERAVRWDNGLATYLDMPERYVASAHGINDLGQVVGAMGIQPYINDWRFQAVVWNGTTPTVLATPGGMEASADRINNAGQIAGHTMAGWGSTALLWNQGVPTVLPGSEPYYIGFNYIAAIDSAGRVLGDQMGQDWTRHLPTLWVDGQPQVLSDGRLYLNDMNDGGQMVGYLRVTDLIDAAVFRGPDGAWTYGPDGSTARAINNDGVAIGWAGKPVVWDGNVPVDIASLMDPSFEEQGWALTGVEQINDVGTIYATAARDGQVFHVLLNPVPEPGTWVLMLIGLAGSAAWARRARR